MTDRARRPEVEAELQSAQLEAIERWPALAGSLRAETVASLTRIALGQGNSKVCAELVLKHLHRRAAGIAVNNSRGLAPQESQEIVEKVLHLITETLLSTKEPIHYMEISFGSFVKRKTFNFTRDARRRDAGAEMLPIDDSKHLDPTFDKEQSEGALRSAFRSMEIRLTIERVLSRFPDTVRAAFHYWYVEDLPIEATDPVTMSIAKLTGRDKRTIYLWLRRIFDAMKEEIGERNDIR